LRIIFLLRYNHLRVALTCLVLAEWMFFYSWYCHSWA